VGLLVAKPFQFFDFPSLLRVGEKEGEIQGADERPGATVVETVKGLDWTYAPATDVITDYGSPHF
jgi:hypothetical protein